MFISPPATASLAGLKEVPSRIVVAKWGKNESANGDFFVGPTTKKVLPALQKLLGFEEITFDFEHNTVPGTAAYKADKEPRNVAANRVRLEVVEGEGLVAHGMQWTPHGDKSIKENLHPDLSPTVKTNDRGEVVFVHSVALCRQGAVTGLHVHSAADIFDAEKLSAFSAALGNPATLQPPANMDYKKLLTILLGLAPNASDADIESACKTFSEGVSAVKAHSATLTALQQNLTALTQRLEKGDRERIVADAIKAGKLVPHGAEIDKLGNEQFKALLDVLPAGVVPLDQRTPEGLKTHAASVTTQSGSTAADAEVARQMGNDPEKLKKYGEKVR